MEKEYLETLVNNCLVFTDRNGIVLSQGSSPFFSFLEKEYKTDKLQIYFLIQQSDYTNGSLDLRVTSNEKLVFKATGDYVDKPSTIKIEKYKPGKWEREVLIKK
ncbi:MAG: hypothetical protein KKA62_06075 [Nanoarchaeota archaeon]|nr:hypothetical protein [Nanoarchaeota archaeon]MBU1644077.1 hypothetical protein [Nanoarchaeota archaeon]MBU1977492.1 hypothetical protein [Nanoarchaeota archaeon]